MRDYTVVYSSASKEALENLINETILLFNSQLSIDDMFYYGVFCKNETYANFKHWDEAPVDLIIPTQLTNACSSSKDRITYVKEVIHNILQGSIEKPEWMLYVEMEEFVSEYNLAPSTFLYIYPKEEKYRRFGEKLIEFLYSPNLLITMIK